MRMVYCQGGCKAGIAVSVLQLLYLPAFCCSAGGVELLAKQGRIKVVNTLESRLEMMSKQVCISLCTDPFCSFISVLETKLL